MNELIIYFDPETNQAISGMYNGGPIEGNGYKDGEEWKLLPEHIEKTIEFLNDLSTLTQAHGNAS